MRTNSFHHILPPLDHRPWWRRHLPALVGGLAFVLWLVFVVVR